jgi:hypothetical protein
MVGQDIYMYSGPYWWWGKVVTITSDGVDVQTREEILPSGDLNLRCGTEQLLRFDNAGIFLVSSTFPLVGSSTASMRRMTHIGRITSGYFPRLKRSRRTSSAMPQMKETILLCVA